MSFPAAATPMAHETKMRLRAAAAHASRVLPGAIGSLLAREFLAAEEFGYGTPDSLAIRAADDVFKLSREDLGAALMPPRTDTAAARVRATIRAKVPGA